MVNSAFFITHFAFLISHPRKQLSPCTSLKATWQYFRLLKTLPSRAVHTVGQILWVPIVIGDSFSVDLCETHCYVVKGIVNHIKQPERLQTPKS